MSEKVATSPPIYRFGNYVLDTKQKSLFYSEQIIPLSQKSFECLLLLVENAEKVVLKEDFFQKIWTDSFVEDGVLAVNISNLRKSLETNQNQRYIETIPRRGYRFLAKVTVEFNDSDQNLLDNSQITDEFNNDFSEKNNEFEVDEIENRPNIDEIINKEIPIVRFKFSKIHFLALSILIILLGLTAFFIYQKYIQKKTDAVTKVSVAVFPFENISGNQDLNYLSLSMSDSLGYSLASLTHVGVVPTSIIKKYVGQNYDPIVEAGNLKVENIVTGSYRTQGNKVFFEVQLKDVTKTNNLVQSQIFEANLDNLTTLRTTIFKFLIQGLNLNKTDFELSEIQKQETQNPLAYEYYLKGSTAYFNSQLDSSINYYQKALELDPNFLLALEGIATDYLQKGSVAGCGAPCYQKSIEYREQIVRIAPEYERGQLNLALLYVDSNQIDKAVPIIKTILAKNKESKHGLFVLAYAYRYAGLIDESIRLTEKSQALELMDSTPSTPTTSYIYASQYEKFLQTFHSPPNNPYG
ncbi:MAG TPA: winged helix-turn-helix domain-containing protein, partial [Pyrinomonadaceae bacterium]|nr:winged helix-turn-helix domain-containing protein [Pyrinomonadaceae bacterium]